MYKIVNNKQLNWVMNFNWFYIWVLPMIIFLILLNLRPQYLFYIIPIYIPVGIIGFIRGLKDTPGNIESKFMRNSMCFQLIFLSFVMIILFIGFLGRV